MTKAHPTSLVCAALGCAAFLVAGAGCESNGPEPRDLMAEEARSAQSVQPVAMRGEAAFDGGQLRVVASVARGFERIGKGGGAARGERLPRHRWGQRKATDAFSEDYNFDFGDSDEEQKQAVEAYLRQIMARRAAGSPMPPVTLHVVFENRSDQPMQIVPTDVDSELGNFAVRPPSLTIAPGAKAALDPMISQLGVTNDVIPLTISVRIGRQSETEVVQLKTLLPPGSARKS